MPHLKYNSSGTHQWTSRYNYNDHDDAASGLATNSSGHIVVTGGSAQATDNWDFASVKYNYSTGAQMTVQRNTASGLGIDRVNSMAIDADDNVYLTGRSAITAEGYNIRTIKLDSLLATVWNKQYNLADADDEGMAVWVDGGGNVYVTGTATNEESKTRGVTLKYNSAGTLQWTALETPNNGEALNSSNRAMSLSEDSQIMVVGTVENGANTDIVTYLYNTDGDRLWVERWDGGGNDIAAFIHADGVDELFIGGISWDGTANTYTLIRYKRADYITPPDDDPDQPAYAGWWENKGQIIDTDATTRPDILYYTNRHYPALYATDDSLFMVFSHIDTSTTTDDTLTRIDMGFVGSSSTKTIMKANSQGGEYHNFFLAHTGAAGITNVQKTDKLYTKDLYPKVDLMHAFDKAGVKYYLIIQPGYSQQNDPIEMVFNGAAITFNSDTTLTLETDLGGITLRKPEAYQIEADGSRTDMAWYPQYTNAGGGVVGFTLGSYTSSKELVLEFGLLPVEFEEGYYNEGIYWSTVYGIYNSGDKIVDCQYFSDGKPALLLQSQSQGFPAIPSPESLGDLTGLTDIAIHQFDNHRASWWATYWGGTLADLPEEMAVHNTKGYYVTGYTTSEDFYTVAYPGGYFEDGFTATASEGFITRINAYGTSSDWSIYIAGTDHLYTIGFSEDQNEFSIGGTVDAELPVEDILFVDAGGSAFYEEDADYSKNAFSYIASFSNATLEATWATKYWGLRISSLAYGQELEDFTYYDRINIGGYITDAFYFESIDASDGGNAIGESFDFGEGELDPYFATFRHDKELVWATPYGGDGQDYVEKLVRGEWGNTGNHLYALGRAGNNIGETEMTWPAETSYTGSEYYYKDEYTDVVSPTVHSYDGYIIKFNYDRDIVFSTLFGGDGSDEILDAGFSNIGEIWFSGRTSSDNTSFPYTTYTGYYDDQDDLEVNPLNQSNAFLSVLTPVSILGYASYYGNTQSTSADCLTVQPVSYGNHVLTAGYLGFLADELDGFLPIQSLPYIDNYWLYENPFPSETYTTHTAHITEWGPFSVAESIIDHSDWSMVAVFPNPASILLNVASSFSSFDKVEVYDLNGQKVLECTNVPGNHALNITNLPSGLYLLIMVYNETIDYAKFIKQ
jgi:hypothetical protein